MYKKLFLSLGLVAALATGIFAQTTNPTKPVAIKFMSGEMMDPTDEITRPRRVEVKTSEAKTSGVAASVMVNLRSIEHITFNMVNRKRVENGLQPLAWNDELENIARGHSQNMADFKFFNHRDLDGKMVSDRADDAGLGVWRAIGENIAFNRGFQNPLGEAVKLWLESPSHKNNMMSETWRESAIGVAIASDGSYYFTQVFLARK